MLLNQSHQSFSYSELRNYLDNFILLIVTLIAFIITKTYNSCNVFLTVSFPKRTSTYGMASIIGLSKKSHTNGADRFIMQTYKQNICAHMFEKLWQCGIKWERDSIPKLQEHRGFIQTCQLIGFMIVKET